mmetsp:Transcript_2854/g.8847  ORF Transcript_2854/g.8847 Transcript_2854/m.8847 type:complete len:364 (-) Transcript_2854:341-1432(-)
MGPSSTMPALPKPPPRCTHWLFALRPTLSVSGDARVECPRSLRVLGKEKRGIVPAKAEVVRHDSLEPVDVLHRVGHVVEVEFRVGIVQIDRRRDVAGGEHLDGDRGLDRASRAEQVARHRLGARDLEPLRVLAKGALDRHRFELVVERRRRAVRVDVAHIRLCDARLHDRRLERGRQALAFGVRSGNVVRVARRAVAGELAVDPRAARLRVRLRLEQQRARALTHDEAGALGVKRARRPLRIVVHVGAHRAHVTKAGVAERRDGRLRAAAQHHVREAQLDVFRRLADRMRAGRACRDDAKVGPLRAQLDRNDPGRRVANHHRDKEGGNALRPLAEHGLRILLERVDAADARAHQHAKARLVNL